MKPNQVFALVTLVSALSMGPSFVSQAHARGNHGGHPERIFQKLNLTPEQKTKLSELRKQGKEEGKALRENLKASHERLETAMKSGASKDELMKQHQEVQKLRNQMSDLRFNRILSIREMLTPEQRAKFHEMKPKRKGRGKGDVEDDQD